MGSVDRSGRDTKQDVQGICLRIAETLAYELVDAGIEKEGAGRYLRVYIDKPGGVSLDDCEIFHRAVQPKLEHVDYDFLEVSSPGLDRPLKSQRDFDRHIGQLVSVKLFRAEGGKKEFEGTLTGLIEGEILLTTEGGQALRFAQKAAAIVRPIISMEGVEDVPFPPGDDD